MTTVEPETNTNNANFIAPPDGGGGTKECDPWVQDCPAGEKCMPYSGDGDFSWESLKCTPVMENPGQTGDPCTVEGNGVSGIDSCDVGHMCWNTDPDTGEGTCIKFCSGSPDAPSCDVPDTACRIANDGVLLLCLKICYPLAQNCPTGQVCLFNDFDNFICDFDASGDMGAYGHPCTDANACDDGLYCALPETVPACDNPDGCCSPYCDLTEPNTCPGMAGGQECVPWYTEGLAPPGQETIGACAIPA